MESLVHFVEDQFITKKDFPEFSSGDTVTVYYEIKEGEKTRTQSSRGLLSREEEMVLQRHSRQRNVQVLVDGFFLLRDQ